MNQTRGHLGNPAEGGIGVTTYTMAALMLAVFTVSVGYGVVLPLLPDLIERLLGASVPAQISRHTGLLTATYALSLFLFAPLWGWICDRHGPRGVLLIGLVGFAATMFVFSFIDSLVAMYAERFLSGLFSAAVTPVAGATIGNFVTTEHGRARRFAFVGMAGIAGFLLGPMLSVFVTRLAARMFPVSLPAGSITVPLAATAVLALLASIVAAFAVQGGTGQKRLPKALVVAGHKSKWLVPKLLALTFIVSTGIGTFEVALALRGKQELGLTPYQIASMFSECSLVMFLIQATVFSPWFKPEWTRWLIAPALFILATALYLVPHASDFTLMLAVIGAVAGSAGVLSPLLTYWISARAGDAQGWALGRQTAASSLGVTAGSAAGGLLYNIATLPGAALLLTAGLAALGFLLSLGLAKSLAVNGGGHGLSQRPCS